MSTPTVTQIRATLKRVVELCDPRHIEGHGPMAWPCSLPLATRRADDYAGVLRSPASNEGGRGSAISNPTLQQALTALSAPTRRPADGDVKPPAYDCDQKLHDATVELMRDCWWLLTASIPAQPSIKPATVAMTCRSVSDRINTRALHEYAALVRHGQELVALVLDLCHTDTSSFGRQATGADCLGCARFVPGTPNDRLRSGLCDKCRKAYERASSSVTGLDRATWARNHLAAMAAAPPEPVHIDPTQHGRVVA